MKKVLSFKFVILCFLIISCKKKIKYQTNDKKFVQQKLEYAKGFEIYKSDSLTKIIVKNPYKNNTQNLIYLFSKSPDKNKIQIPVQKFITTSTTHIPMIELLDYEDKIIGFPNTKYVSSKKTRKLIDKKQIKEIGQEANLNSELVLDLQPDVIIGFSVNKTDKSLNFLEQNGIHVLYNGDWLEQTPLGRAEWIKFFGVLFDKEQQANRIFNKIKNDYLHVKKIAKKTNSKPSVLSGAIMQNDSWTLPAGKSFMAQLFKDANTNYLFENTKGNGSLQLSIEAVFEKGQQADYWISPGFFSSKKMLVNNNKLCFNLKAFRENKIYTPNLKKGETGGILFFEIAPTRPDLVLKDLIKITNPKLLDNYKLTFFEKME